MLYKLLSFILVYILSIINFVIILSPLLIFVVPIVMMQSQYIKSNSSQTLILLMFFIVSCFMIIIMLFDFLFGLSTKHYVKTAKDYKKLKDYDILETPFEDVKSQFNKPKVKLLISSSEESNAYAIGNMGKQYIVITKGLISTYLLQMKGKEYFINSIKCIIGHEMSHLINRDYLPGLLLQINEQATRFLSKIILGFLNIFINILHHIPIAGRILSNIIISIHKLLDFLISFFYKYVILSIYKFIQLKISREKEYRCDMQSAKASGGKNMAEALSVLGENGYITIFSTHPKTVSRIHKVQSIEKTDEQISPEKGNIIVNFLSIVFILILPLLIYYYMDIRGLVENYYDVVYHIKMSFRFLKMRIATFFRIL